jgi:Integrase core domain
VKNDRMSARFFRTLKQQAIYGRIFRIAAEVAAAVAEFVARYNSSWRLARLRYPEPARLPGATLCGVEPAEAV